jgi:hypothetical protein
VREPLSRVASPPVLPERDRSFVPEPDRAPLGAGQLVPRSDQRPEATRDRQVSRQIAPPDVEPKTRQFDSY